MPRCYILKKHVNQSKSTVKDKPVLGDGNTTQCWQPKTSNVALKRHDTPISPTEVYASICYNNTLENQSGKCFLKFFIFNNFFHLFYRTKERSLSVDNEHMCMTVLYLSVSISLSALCIIHSSFCHAHMRGCNRKLLFQHGQRFNRKISSKTFLVLPSSF